MSSQTIEGKIEDLKRKSIKSDQRIDELSKRVRMLERQVMKRVGIGKSDKMPHKDQCKYCGVMISRGDLCGRCKAILGEDS